MAKRPAFQFYPSDWRTDASLRLCSIGARGLWIEMMCLMHEGEPYGHLTVQGRPIQPGMLARLVGEGLAPVKRWLAELEANDVFSVTGEGVAFSRRMVRDEQLRDIRAAGGPAGADHGQKGASHGKKGGRPRKAEPPLGAEDGGFLEPPSEPPPSSSSSSSSPPSGNTLAKANGASADSDAQFWDAAKSFISGETRNPGALVGKWCRDYGKSETASVVTRAQLERPAQRIPFIEGALRATRKVSAGGYEWGDLP